MRLKQSEVRTALEEIFDSQTKTECLSIILLELHKNSLLPAEIEDYLETVFENYLYRCNRDKDSDRFPEGGAA